MKKCPDCKCECGDDAKFCEECGYKFPQTKQCPKCHAELKLTAKFCMECGYSFQGQQDGGGKPFLGDNNMVSGDVVGGNLDRRTYNGNVTTNNTSNVTTTNNVTNNTTSIVNNNIDESRKMVQCHVCKKNMTIDQSYTCKSCGKYVCADCRDNISGLCNHCLEDSAEGMARKLFSQAETLRLTQKNAEAMELYARILSLDNLSREFAAKANNAIGWILSNENRKKYDWLVKQLDEAPNGESIAQCEKCVAATHEAIEYVKKASLLEPGNEHYKENIAKELENLAGFQRLAEELKRRDSCEGRAEVEAINALKLVEAGDYKEATELLLPLVELEGLPSQTLYYIYYSLSCCHLATLTEKIEKVASICNSLGQDNFNEVFVILNDICVLQEQLQKYAKIAGELIASGEAKEDKSNPFRWFKSDIDSGVGKIPSLIENTARKLRTFADAYYNTNQFSKAVELYLKILELKNIPNGLRSDLYNDVAVSLAKENVASFNSFDFAKKIVQGIIQKNELDTIEKFCEVQNKAIEYYSKSIELLPSKTKMDNRETAKRNLEQMLLTKAQMEAKTQTPASKEEDNNDSETAPDLDVIDYNEGLLCFDYDNVSVTYTVKLMNQKENEDVCHKIGLFLLKIFDFEGYFDEYIEIDGPWVSIGTEECKLQYDGNAADDLPWTNWYNKLARHLTQPFSITAKYEVFVKMNGKHVLLQQADNYDGGKIKTVTVDMLTGCLLSHDNWDFTPVNLFDAIHRACDWDDDKEEKLLKSLNENFAEDIAKWPVIVRNFKYTMTLKRQKKAYLVVRNPKNRKQVYMLLDKNGQRLTVDRVKGYMGEDQDDENICLKDFWTLAPEPEEERKKFSEYDTLNPDEEDALDIADNFFATTDNDDVMEGDSDFIDDDDEDYDDDEEEEDGEDYDDEEDEEEIELCPKCGAERLEGKKFCLKCGFKFPEDEIEVEDEEEDEDLEEDEEDEMECCPKCEAERKEGKKFCTKCGYRFPD